MVTRGHPGGKLSHFSLFQAQGELVLHRIYRKNIPKDNHFSQKLQKESKLLPVSNL